MGMLQLIYEALPEGTVQFGHALESLSQDEGGVKLKFSDQPDVRAEYVVAADGYFSPTRESMLDDGPPEFQVSTGRAGCHESHQTGAPGPDSQVGKCSLQGFHLCLFASCMQSLQPHRQAQAGNIMHQVIWAV